MHKTLNSDSGKYVELAGEVRHQTPGAVLFFDGAREVWIPKSLLEDYELNYVLVPEWFAYKEGLI